MSQDNIFNFLYNFFDFSNNKGSSRVVVSKVFLKNNNTSVLKIIIPPRGGGESFIDKILIKRLYKKGYSCLSYYVSSSILSSNINETIKSFDLLVNQIKADISELKNEHDFKRIDVIATSLGVIGACLTANNNNSIDNLFFIVPGSSLALPLWDGISTQDLRTIYEKQNINREQLESAWKTLAPKNNVSLLSDKNIFISISKQDNVIPYVFGKEFVDLFKKIYPNKTTIQESSYLGHYLTILKYYLFSDDLLK